MPLITDHSIIKIKTEQISNVVPLSNRDDVFFLQEQYVFTTVIDMKIYSHNNDDVDMEICFSFLKLQRDCMIFLLIISKEGCSSLWKPMYFLLESSYLK